MVEIGTTACKWDSVIPLDKMWEKINKLIKPNGAIVLIGSEPFSSKLRMSNVEDDLCYPKIRDLREGTLRMIHPRSCHKYAYIQHKLVIHEEREISS